MMLPSNRLHSPIAKILVLTAWIALITPANAGKLHNAIEEGNINAVEAAIAGGADISEPVLMFGMPLHLACRNGEVTIVT